MSEFSLLSALQNARTVRLDGKPEIAVAGTRNRPRPIYSSDSDSDESDDEPDFTECEDWDKMAFSELKKYSIDQPPWTLDCLDFGSWLTCHSDSPRIVTRPSENFRPEVIDEEFKLKKGSVPVTDSQNLISVLEASGKFQEFESELVNVMKNTGTLRYRFNDPGDRVPYLYEKAEVELKLLVSTLNKIFENSFLCFTVTSSEDIIGDNPPPKSHGIFCDFEGLAVKAHIGDEAMTLFVVICKDPRLGFTNSCLRRLSDTIPEDDGLVYDSERDSCDLKSALNYDFIMESAIKASVDGGTPYFMVHDIASTVIARIENVSSSSLKANHWNEEKTYRCGGCLPDHSKLGAALDYNPLGESTPPMPEVHLGEVSIQLKRDLPRDAWVRVNLIINALFDRLPSLQDPDYLKSLFNHSSVSEEEEMPDMLRNLNLQKSTGCHSETALMYRRAMSSGKIKVPQNFIDFISGIIQKERRTECYSNFEFSAQLSNQVYKVTHKSNAHRAVVLKLFDNDPQGRAGLMYEVCAYADSKESPHVAEVYEYGTIKGHDHYGLECSQFYMLLEYVRGDAPNTQNKRDLGLLQKATDSLRDAGLILPSNGIYNDNRAIIRDKGNTAIIVGFSHTQSSRHSTESKKWSYISRGV